MSAADELYPPPIPDALPALPVATTPERKLCLVDYHLQGAPVAVPSRDADVFAGHLHGWLYHLQGADADERRPVDADQETAPFAAWLLADSHRSRRPGQVSVRVCWYDQGAAQRSIAALATNPTALIGSRPYALSGISPVSREPITAASILHRGEEAAHLIRLHTISPVGFRNHTRWHCSMDPSTVLGSAISRWSKLWPGTLPWGPDATANALERARQLGWLGRIAMPACELRSVVVQRSKVEQSCVRGWAEYDLYALSPEQRRVALALLRGAEAFGLGSRCAYGLGAIGLEIVR